MAQVQKPGLFAWGLLIILTIIWGFSYYFIKHSLVSFNPSQVASLRMVFSAIALSPFLLKALKSVERINYPMIFLSDL
ncbi:MAG: EamA family transporter [Saprospiraceae bacterium]|nr:EamA family transporter [Saprospiraceae bacterium]